MPLPNAKFRAFFPASPNPYLVLDRPCQFNVAEAKRPLVERCSLCGGRIWGDSGNVMPDREAFGKLTAMTSRAKLFILEREMLTDRLKARQKTNGYDALATLERCKPDVIVMDLGMPDMDGYETIRRIRQQPAGRTIIAIALTGWNQVDTKRRTAEAGFDHQLVKPVDFEKLRHLLVGSTETL